MFAFINNREVKESEAVVSIFDRGFLYGDGIFETLRVYDGKVFRMAQHMERMFTNFARLKIPSPLSAEQISANVERLVRDNGVRDGFVRIIATRGISDFGLGTKTARDPIVVIYAQDYPPPSAERYAKGWSVIIASERANAQSVMEVTKTISRVHHVLAKMEAEEKGADDAVLINTDGFLAEGTTSNLFLVKNGAVQTAPVSTGLLPGITRATIREVCDLLDVPFEEKLLRPEELFAADEAFLSSTMVELMPIVKVDGRQIGNGRPGGLTKKLHTAFQELVREEIHGAAAHAERGNSA
jgi:branched-chain amino acid aminotransferase